MNNANQPAFPQSYEKDETRHDIIKRGGEPQGLNKREYLAAMAMQGFISAWPEHAGNISPNSIASYAISCADELLKQLEA